MTKKFLALLFRMLSALPLRVRRAWGRGGGYLFALLPLKERRIAELQMAACLGNRGINYKVREVYAHFGQTLMEAIELGSILNNNSVPFECDRPEIIEKIRLHQGPVIALTGHCGNWDLLAAYIISKGVPVAAAGRTANNATLQELLVDLRARYGIKTLWRAEFQTVQGILRELRAGQVVAALIDQDTVVHSAFAPFFGRLAKTPSGLVTLAKRVGAMLFTAFLFREGPGYKIYMEELDSALPVETILTEYNQRLEKLICKYPEQWAWVHKRWRSLPNGETLSSQEYLALLTQEARHEI